MFETILSPNSLEQLLPTESIMYQRFDSPPQREKGVRCRRKFPSERDFKTRERSDGCAGEPVDLPGALKENGAKRGKI